MLPVDQNARAFEVAMQDADRAAGGTGALHGKASATPEPGVPNYGNWVWFPSDVGAPWDALEKEPNCRANLGYPIDWKEDLPVPNEISQSWPVCNTSNSMITCKLYADLWLGKSNPRTISNPGCNLETFRDTDVLSRALNAFIEVIVFHFPLSCEKPVTFHPTLDDISFMSPSRTFPRKPVWICGEKWWFKHV